MGVLYEYFSAASDAEAGAVAGRVGGPADRSVEVAPLPARRGWFRRRAEPELVDDPDLPVYDTVSLKGVDPVVQLGTLEELLTGRPYDDLEADPRSGHLVGGQDADSGVVCTLTDGVVAALAAADDARLAEVAGPWSRAEEFGGDWPVEEVLRVLRDLAALARRAQAAGLRLYCWICV